MKLLSSVSKYSSVAPAILNGATEISIPFFDIKNKKNDQFTAEKFVQISKYCRLRGIPLYMRIDGFFSDDRLEHISKSVAFFIKHGISAFIVSDIGVLKMIHIVSPTIPVFADEAVGIRSASGIKKAEEYGFARVFLPRELSREHIESLCKDSPLEISVCIYSPSCICCKGTCRFSNYYNHTESECTHPCNGTFRFSGSSEMTLGSKDTNLSHHLSELINCGVSCLEIKGDGDEYFAFLNAVFSRCINEGQNPSFEESKLISRAFSPYGSTDSYFSGTDNVFKGDSPQHIDRARLISYIRDNFIQGPQRQTVSIKFHFNASADRPCTLSVEDTDGNLVTVKGPSATRISSSSSFDAYIKARLYNTSSTPFVCKECSVKCHAGLSVSGTDVEAMKTDALNKLSAMRMHMPDRRLSDFKIGIKYLNKKNKPQLVVSLSNMDQLSQELFNLKPPYIYMPIEQLVSNVDLTRACVTCSESTMCAVLPPVFSKDEHDELLEMLKIVRSLGIGHVVCSSLDFVDVCKSMGMKLHGDIGLNVKNYQNLKALKKDGFDSAVLSYDMTFNQIKKLSKGIDCELVLYGRIPLMLTESCIIKSKMGRCACENTTSIQDKSGNTFPVVRSYRCRNTILSPKKLFFEPDAYNKLGLWGARLYFTTENSKECVKILERYMGISKHNIFSFTHGNYLSDIEQQKRI